MGLKALERQTLREKIVEALKAFILENELKPGDRLPTEHELAERLSVGQSSVREALKSLEAIGAIESRTKIGHVLRSVDMSLLSRHISFSEQVSGVTVAELLEARAFLETNIIPLVIQKGDPAVLEEMAEGLKMVEEVTAGTPDWREAEKKFHMALFRGAHNSVLQSFGEVIEGFFVGLEAEHPVMRGQRWVDDHRAIYEALKDGDTALAQTLMRTHLNRYSERVSYPDSRPSARRVA
ncbi:MAG: FadR family transcriptional regulator [Candidatus Latescibacteria bacterium]|nr:FadR family transcriptional regulator [Candidatus Latescibacterota bacterium]